LIILWGVIISSEAVLDKPKFEQTDPNYYLLTKNKTKILELVIFFSYFSAVLVLMSLMIIFLVFDFLGGLLSITFTALFVFLNYKIDKLDNNARKIMIFCLVLFNLINVFSIILQLPNINFETSTNDLFWDLIGNWGMFIPFIGQYIYPIFYPIFIIYVLAIDKETVKLFTDN
jgi:hypothetical protein